MRNDFQSVYFFIERRGGTFHKLEPWNKRKYVWPSRLRGIDAFHSVLSANFVAILLSPNFARRRASNLCVLYRVYKKKLNKPEIVLRLCIAPQCTKFFIEIGCFGTDNVV